MIKDYPYAVNSFEREIRKTKITHTQRQPRREREMAYTAVDSLRYEIDYYVGSSFILVDPGSRELLEFASKQVEPLKAIVRRMLLSSTSSLDLEMGVAISKLKDEISSHILKKSPYEARFCMELQDLKQAFHSTIEMLKKMEEEYAKEGEDNSDDDDSVSSRIGFGAHIAEMVRSSPQYVELKLGLVSPKDSFGPVTFSLVGMPGIGKTTLAMEIFKDPDILKHFNCLAWVTVGRKYRFEEIGRCILAEVDPDRYRILEGAGEDCIARTLRECLKGKRYLIVLDDVRNKYMAHHLYPSHRDELRNPFPYVASQSRVLLTTRLRQVEQDCLVHHDVLTMRLLDKEESWDLLREKVFGEEPCPSQLEKDGKKIAEICGGLPLTIVTVADLLSKADPEKTPQYWNEVATRKNHQLFKTAYNAISKVLYSCYKDLTHVLKLCFLYMGIFPQNHETSRSKIIDMWNVDGFFQINAHKFPCPSALKCLEELVFNSLIMIYESTVDPTSAVGQKQTKTCGLHSSLWHLSNREARKSKFSLVLDTYDDCFGESIKSQSRLSFHNNILLGFKNVYESVEDNCASTTRSLLFYGSYHRYQVPICSGLVLLKELDALAIRFYEFPIEVQQLVELRYLALTMNGKIPPSISKLSNLQILIVGQHLSIKCGKDPSYLPVKIWDMKELKHLQVMGNDLPDPRGASLESLVTLKNVSAHSCREGILTAIPNLRKLGIHIELAPHNDGEPLSCFNHISLLKTLTSFKCVVVNPKVVPALALISIFPPRLKKLSLSGLSYPWKELGKITSSLRHLSVLKLRDYAFRGPIWEVKKEAFYALHLLIIEDTDLVEWTIEHESLYYLKSLKMKHCYKLKKIHGKLGICEGGVELVDCSPLGVKHVKQAIPWPLAKVVVYSSWEAQA